MPSGLNVKLVYLWPALAFLLGTTAYAGDPTYKCQNGGKVEYSDNPCVGATVVDTTPTKGLDKSTGRSLKGASVQREERNEVMANALKPLLGWTPAQRETATKRVNLPAAAQRECSALDAAIPREEATNQKAASGDKARTEVELYKSRKKFKDLKC